MSHAELRESFTAASAANYLSTVATTTTTTAEDQPPSMGVSPHTQQRDGLLPSNAVLSIQAAAIVHSAEEAKKRSEQVARMEENTTGNESFSAAAAAAAAVVVVGGEGEGVSMGVSPNPLTTGHVELRESFTGATVLVSGDRQSVGSTPPSLNPVFSPHGRQREETAAAAAATDSTTPPYRPSTSVKSTPTARGIAALAAPSTLPYVLPNRTLSPTTNAGPLGLGDVDKSGGNGSLTGLRFGVSPFATGSAHSNVANSLRSRSNDENGPVPSFSSSAAVAMHNELREGVTASGAASQVGGADMVHNNISFGTTPHTELREGGSILSSSANANAARAHSLAESFARDLTSGGDTHTNLRESFAAAATSGGGGGSGGSSTTSAAAAAAAAAIEKEKALQKKTDEKSPLFAVSPFTGAAAGLCLDGGDGLATGPVVGASLHGLAGTPVVPMGTSLTVHTALRESFASPALCSSNPDTTPYNINNTNNNINNINNNNVPYDSPTSMMSASLGSHNGVGRAPLAAVPRAGGFANAAPSSFSSSPPLQGYAPTQNQQQQQSQQQRQHLGPARVQGKRLVMGGSVASSVSGTSAPLVASSPPAFSVSPGSLHHQLRYGSLNQQNQQNLQNLQQQPQPFSVEPRSNPHRDLREQSSSAATSPPLASDPSYTANNNDNNNINDINNNNNNNNSGDNVAALAQRSYDQQRPRQVHENPNAGMTSTEFAT